MHSFMIVLLAVIAACLCQAMVVEAVSLQREADMPMQTVHLQVSHKVIFPLCKLFINILRNGGIEVLVYG